ncbi:MAG: PAS domain-containing protein, partial [Acidobacteria bacterium]|nr:PAS domain-containing protein [Acidobacteriota bacterium]
ILVIDPDNLRILDANQKVATRLGYSTEEMLVLNADCIFPECRNLLRDTDSEKAVMDNWLVAKDGRTIKFALTIQRIKTFWHFPHPVALLIARESANESRHFSKGHPVAPGAIAGEREDLAWNRPSQFQLLPQQTRSRVSCSTSPVLSQKRHCLLEKTWTNKYPVQIISQMLLIAII